LLHSWTELNACSIATEETGMQNNFPASF
jgi:hypothetical protein